MATASPVDLLRRLAADLDALAAADFWEIAKYKILDEHRGDAAPESVVVLYRVLGYLDSTEWHDLQDALTLVPRPARYKMQSHLQRVAESLDWPLRHLRNAGDIVVLGEIAPRPGGAVASSGRITKPDVPPMTEEERVAYWFEAEQIEACRHWQRAQFPIKRASAYVAKVLETVTAKLYSEPGTPDDWAKVFGQSWKTIRRRIDAGELRAIEVHSKSWRIHRADLPAAAPRKQKVDKSGHARF